MSVSAYQHIVFDSNSSPAWKINPRFNRHHHSGFQDVLGRSRKARAFVNLQSDAVTQPVTEVLAPSGLGNNVPRDRVDLGGGDPRAESPQSPAAGRSTQLHIASQVSAKSYR